MLYRGAVTVKLLKGKKVYKTIEVKNNGSSEFFRILCNAVIGNSVNNLMPNCVEIRGHLAGSETEIALTSIRVHYSTVSINESQQQYSAEFVFVIPGSMLINGTATKLDLYNSTSQSQYLAEVVLGSGETFPTDSNSNLMITWNLSFQNPA